VRRNKGRGLIEALDRHDPEVRAAAAGLTDLGDMQAVERLAHRVHSHPDPAARHTAAALQRLLDELEESGYQGDYVPLRGHAVPFRQVLTSSG
jgi:hypothetical protein